MTDEELGNWLGFTPEEAKIAIPKLTPQRRAHYERMADIYVEIRLWEDGIGPLPKAVMVDGPRQISPTRRTVRKVGLSYGE